MDFMQLDMYTNDKKEITIEQIYNRSEISIRSYNVCKNNDINTVSELIEVYYKQGSFEKFRNCGVKSNLELIKICGKYNDDYIYELQHEQPVISRIEEILNELTRIQREVINSYIIIQFNDLSVRSRNALSAFLEDNLKIKNLASKLLIPSNLILTDIQNIGVKSSEEIEKFISQIEDFLIQVSESQDEKFIISLKNELLIKNKYSIDNVPSDLLASESIFKLIEFLIKKNALFKKEHTIILTKGFHLYNNQEMVILDDIGEEIEISKERVRQIRININSELFDKLAIIKNFNDDIYQKYNIDIESNIIEITTEIIDNINVKNNTNFTKKFIAFILAVYLQDEFSLIGNTHDVFFTSNSVTSRTRHNWNNLYIVKKEFATEFDFISLADDISKRLNFRIEETYSFDFKSYYSQYALNNNFNYLNTLKPIIEEFINSEFNLYLDYDENIVFTRNTEWKIFEYSYEALKNLGKPSSVKEILCKVLENYPDKTFEESSIRASLKRSHGFLPKSRTSVFGLKEWEDTLDNFKGGTIRSITAEYLISRNKPIHILELAEYIIRFREDTYAQSILDNLKADESGDFIFFKQSFIGLETQMHNYNINKYDKLPRFLGKRLIALHQKGYSLVQIEDKLINKYSLNKSEANYIINNLNYFNENK